MLVCNMCVCVCVGGGGGGGGGGGIKKVQLCACYSVEGRLYRVI